MYGKLEDGCLITAPKKLTSDGATVYNPPAEMYLAQGWKLVVFTDPPETPDGYYYENGWEEQLDTIIQTWILMLLPDDVDEIEAYEIIFGGLE